MTPALEVLTAFLKLGFTAAHIGFLRAGWAGIPC